MTEKTGHFSSSAAAQDLPPEIPVFPLTGVLLLPRGQLPLNIFEPRYLAMVDDAMRTHRLIGMIQPTGDEANKLFSIGCAGKITQYEETGDGRYLITLTGVSRFKVIREHPLEKGYRRVSVTWTPFEHDLEQVSCLDMDREKLTHLLRHYFDQEGLSADWDTVAAVADERLITALAMVCPFEPAEKQALLEAACCKTRAKLFFTMLEMAICPAGCKADKAH